MLDPYGKRHPAHPDIMKQGPHPQLNRVLRVQSHGFRRHGCQNTDIHRLHRKLLAGLRSLLCKDKVEGNRLFEHQLEHAGNKFPGRLHCDGLPGIGHGLHA